MELGNSIINSIKSSFHEKMLRREFRIITHYLQSFQWSIVGVECTLYQQGLFQTSLERKAVINRFIFLDMLDKFIDSNSKSSTVAWAVKTLYWDYLKSVYKDKYIQISDKEVNLIKELVWVTYYLSQKKMVLPKFGDRHILISALIGCSIPHLNTIEGSAGVILRKICANIISLKDARADLIPYPECANIEDIIELISINCPWEVMIKNLVTEVEYHDDKRTHYVNFAVEL